jgi:CDP-6-deoxy-D-xylo-4-hexulose-3-dehydrase
MENPIIEKRRILFAKPVHGERERLAVEESLKKGWLGPGEDTIRFEEEFCKLIGKKYGIFLNSGSSANLLAMLSLNLPKGSEVITPACTFPTTYNPILQSGNTPVICDVKMGTYNIDIDKLEAALSEKTKAIMAPHAVGSPMETDKIKKFCDEYGLYFVEDSCDTIGSTVNGKMTGYYGDVACFSFYATHHLTCAGGGGMLLTDNEEVLKHVRSYKDWGRSDEFQRYWTKEGEDFERRFKHEVDGIKYDSKYTYDHLGYNFKAVELQAAFGLVQLGRLEEFNAIRRRNTKQLIDFLRKYEDYFILPVWEENADPVFLSFPITVRDGAPFKRYELLKYLEENGVQVRLLFAGNILRHEAYRNTPFRVSGGLEVSDKIMRDTFLVGIHQGIEQEDMNYMCEVFEDFLAGGKR